MPFDSPDTAVLLDGPLAFMRTLWALSHALDRRSKWMSAHHGVTGPQRLAVRVIGRVSAISPGSLASLLHLHPSTLTGIVQRLADRGFVTRARDATDSRRAILVLTDSGRLLDRPTEGTVEACVARVLARYAPEDVRRVEEVLGAITAEIELGLSGRTA